MPFDFSLVSAPFRMQPGLRRVAPGAPQLTPSARDGRHLREKTAVLGRFAGQALLSLPGFDEAAVLSAIAREAERVCPDAWRAEATSSGRLRVAAPRLGWALDDGQPVGDGDAAIGAVLAALPPTQRAAALLSLAFEEDFAVIDGATATLPWLAVCLPSRWAPESKIGRHFAEVHAPVADNAMLLAASDSLARLVTGSERWERFVWTITGDPRLDQHPARGAPAWTGAGHGSAETVGAQAWFRHERQTFVPFAEGQRAIFTIRVDSEPLAEAIASDPTAAPRLHAALASMTPAVLAYRGLGQVQSALLAWLAAHAKDVPAP